DARERPVTAVVGQPCRAANGRRREAANRAEGSLASTPQVPDRAMLALRRSRDPRVPGRRQAALEPTVEQEEVGEGRLARSDDRLDELEDALEEVGRVEPAPAVRDRDAHASLAGVDDRPVEDLGWPRERYEGRRPGLLDQDDAADPG